MTHGNFRINSLASLGLLLLLVSCGGGSSDDLAPAPSIDISQDCQLPVLGQVDVMTADRQEVTSRDDYIDATLEFIHFSHANDNQTLATEIRGRGNSTWDMPKKPYKLKLQQKTELLGMPKGKKYALLANYADKTLLRSEAAFCMARNMGLPHSPQSRTLELRFNDRYDGVYQLTNKTYEAEDLVKADNELDRTPDALGIFEDAFVIELDFAQRHDDWFVTASGIPFQFRSDTNDEQILRVEASFDRLEALISADNDPDRLQKLEQIVDLQSLADFYLIQEFAANPDGFLSSTYVHRLRDGRLTFGPVWDFDQAFGPTKHNVDPEGWLIHGRAYNWYIPALLQEPGFAALVRQRWQTLFERLPSYQQYMLDSAAILNDAQQRNFERWPILGTPVFTNVFAFDTYAEEVDFMVDWLGQRARWMDAHIRDITAAASAG